MATQNQILANRQNAEKSTGPSSVLGREISSQNNFRHGFRGRFRLLQNESEAEFVQFLNDLQAEHNPATPTEQLLVQKMAEHHWLTRRARFFQDVTEMNVAPFDPHYLELYLRYEAQHERAFFKCLKELQTLRTEQRKERKHEAALSQQAEQVKIGFERQRLAAAAESRRNAENLRRQEAHELRQNIAAAKFPLQFPLPNNVSLDKKDIENAIKTAISALVANTAAA